MRLLLRRDQRAGGMPGGKAIFVLQAKTHTSDEERSAIAK